MDTCTRVTKPHLPAGDEQVGLGEDDVTAHLNQLVVQQFVRDEQVLPPVAVIVRPCTWKGGL